MTNAIEKLIEAAEKTVAGTYLDEMRPLRIAIAPARAEWERKRKEREALAASHSDMSRRLTAAEKDRNGEARTAEWKALVKSVEARAERAETALSRLRTELAEARAPMAVTDAAVNALVDFAEKVMDGETEEQHFENLRGSIAAALPHLRPARSPTPEQIAQAEADYDKRPWLSMSRADRDRYLDRAKIVLTLLRAPAGGEG